MGFIRNEKEAVSKMSTLLAYIYKNNICLGIGIIEKDDKELSPDIFMADWSMDITAGIFRTHLYILSMLSQRICIRS